jgi:hypothetical protein
MEVNDQLHTPVTLPLYPLYRRQSRPQSQSGCYGEEKILSLLGIEPQPSSLSLYRLSFPAPLSVIRAKLCKKYFPSFLPLQKILAFQTAYIEWDIFFRQKVLLLNYMLPNAGREYVQLLNLQFHVVLHEFYEIHYKWSVITPK